MLLYNKIYQKLTKKEITPLWCLLDLNFGVTCYDVMGIGCNEVVKNSCTRKWVGKDNFT